MRTSPGELPTVCQTLRSSDRFISVQVARTSAPACESETFYAVVTSRWKHSCLTVATCCTRSRIMRVSDPLADTKHFPSYGMKYGCASYMSWLLIDRILTLFLELWFIPNWNKSQRLFSLLRFLFTRSDVALWPCDANIRVRSPCVNLIAVQVREFSHRGDV